MGFCLFSFITGNVHKAKWLLSTLNCDLRENRPIVKRSSVSWSFILYRRALSFHKWFCSYTVNDSRDAGGALNLLTNEILTTFSKTTGPFMNLVQPVTALLLLSSVFIVFSFLKITCSYFIPQTFVVKTRRQVQCPTLVRDHY